VKHISTQEASIFLGISQRRIQALINSGRLKAEKIGGIWLIPDTAIKNFKPMKAGRPKKVN